MFFFSSRSLFFFKQKTAYDIGVRLVGSEMCIRDRILDVNVGAPGVDEPALMEQVVKALQSVVSLPLQLDSSHADALERGLRVYNGKPIVNSVNGEPEVLEKVLPLCKKYGAAVVGLATVSYTHLTLPTKRIVEISVDAGSLKKKNRRKKKNKKRKIYIKADRVRITEM